jgi:3-oxoacyl-[acyl-carrier protein] reductase
MKEFQEQVVLVTGAGSGVGLGIAKAFYESGANVALCDYRADALESALSQFDEPQRTFGQAVDIRDADSVARFVDASEKAFGPVSVMVANAGIYPNTPVLEMAQSEWDLVMETNVRGVFLSCQAAARSMVAHGTKGKIITLSSGAANSGRRGAAHYCSSKAGVVMFTKVLALELAEYGINVNSISPGLIEVNSEVSPLSAEYTASLTQSIPLGRIGQPSDIAKAALFLASSNADFITGTVLSVDGGSSAGRANLPLSTPGPNEGRKDN